jgi:KDO2-lipid IV(A) lauroyltransferase
VANSPILGAGLTEILAARARGQGVILISGHFGNYDVPRAVLSSLGHPVAGLYWPMRNPYFNRDYVRRISQIGTPVFPRGRRGLAEMVQFMKKGGLVGMLIDQHMDHGAGLTFFGETAFTPTSAAELALKYNCLLVPIYGRRKPDGLNFDLIVEPAIPHSTPLVMTQALNDSLERMTRENLGQWFWIHRRWKVPPHLAQGRDGPTDPV